MLTGGAGASVAGSPGAVRAEVAELLGVSADTVDPDGNLISQGLDSIRMMSLAGRWRRRGIDVDFAALAAEPTIEAWSLLVSAGAVTAEAGRTRPRRRRAHPTTHFRSPRCSTPCGSGATTVSRSVVWPGIYMSNSTAGQSIPTGLRGGCHLLALRHPMLRVRFLSDGTQRIDPAQRTADFPITVHDLRDLADGRRRRSACAGIREAKSHQQLDGQVFELTLSLLPGEKLAPARRFGHASR